MVEESTLPDPEAFYDAAGADEWERLERGLDGRLEFEYTTRILEERLPSSGRVVDVGGGAGRYAVWLAERGYDVTLVDVSDGQLSVARRKIAEHGVQSSVRAVRGSVADLGVESNAFDATCCLGGPLSHLLSATERERAARELRRVTRPDSPVVVSVMGLLGVVQLYIATQHAVRALPELLESGDYDAELLDRHDYEGAFTEMHCFRRSEFESLLADADIDVERVTGLEGIASICHDGGVRDAVEALTDAERAAIERAVRRTNDDPAVADCSIHMLAVGTA